MATVELIFSIFVSLLACIRIFIAFRSSERVLAIRIIIAAIIPVIEVAIMYIRCFFTGREIVTPIIICGMYVMLMLLDYCMLKTVTKEEVTLSTIKKSLQKKTK